MNSTWRCARPYICNPPFSQLLQVRALAASSLSRTNAGDEHPSDDIQDPHETLPNIDWPFLIVGRPRTVQSETASITVTKPIPDSGVLNAGHVDTPQAELTPPLAMAPSAAVTVCCSRLGRPNCPSLMRCAG